MKQHITLRLPTDLIRWLDAQAKKERRSRTNLIEKLLMERKEKEK